MTSFPNSITGGLCYFSRDSRSHHVERVTVDSIFFFFPHSRERILLQGTENHLVLWDLRPCGLTGSKMETICDMIHVTLNKNAVFGDASALAPGGCRIGAPAMTSRGLKEAEFVKIADFLHKAVELALEVQTSHGKMLKDWKMGLEGNPKVDALKAEVEAWAESFEMPGFTKAGVDM